jgi:hypothetical protein
MADKLPFGGGSNSTPNRPKRLLHQQPSWTLPVNSSSITSLEYDFRVGKITEEEYQREVSRKATASLREVASLAPSTRKAVIATPRNR